MSGIELSLPMALVLCDLHDTTGQPIADPTIFSTLLAASMVAELELDGRIHHHDDGRITLKGGRPKPLLELAEGCLGARPISIVSAFEQIAALELRHTVHSHLVGMGALKVTSRRRFFWFKEWTWPTADAAIEEQLRTNVRRYIEGADGPLCRTDILLALLERGDLLGTIWDEPPHTKIRKRTLLWKMRAHLKTATQKLGAVRMQEG